LGDNNPDNDSDPSVATMEECLQLAKEINKKYREERKKKID
jgi:hypothetical protein